MRHVIEFCKRPMEVHLVLIAKHFSTAPESVTVSRNYRNLTNFMGTSFCTMAHCPSLYFLDLADPAITVMTIKRITSNQEDAGSNCISENADLNCVVGQF
ncbi:hypothetical protein CDAR_284011 [Caerostris darwini]|uniref:Uncharacterized protein n=1 Tax=Caerostris darwini TaxID=1538125 RepID=A0AAV4PJ90_9ARAC|nr:hypothetical protein CDAR_284011 [Caerostris darwini]